MQNSTLLLFFLLFSFFPFFFLVKSFSIVYFAVFTVATICGEYKLIITAGIGSRYLVQEFSERDEIWQIDRGALLYVITQIGKLWHGESPSGAKILKV